MYTKYRQILLLPLIEAEGWMMLGLSLKSWNNNRERLLVKYQQFGIVRGYEKHIHDCE